MGRWLHRRKPLSPLPFPAIVLGLISAVFLPSSPVTAQYRESFEAPETSWHLADRDCSVRVVQHVRTFAQAHSGQSSELIQIHSSRGTFVHWTHSIPSSRVIDEWTARLWIKSDHPGLQLLARVVLPRSKDPRTGGPLRMLLPGTIYQQAGTWECLVLDNPAHRLRQQLPKLRAQFGSAVSDREAYIDLLVLNAYGGPGQTTLWIDDLEVTGIASTEPMVAANTPRNPVAEAPRPGPATRPRRQRAALEGTTLVVDGKPQLIRAIQYQGEPFAELKKLGFNAIWLATPPSDEQTQQAAQNDLALIAPPPADRVPGMDTPVAASILCWDLGQAAVPGDEQRLRHLSERLRSVPQAERRPLLCTAKIALWQCSRSADILVLPTPELNGSLPLADLGAWYRQRLQYARLDTPFWATIPTQLAPGICRQIHALGAEMPVPLSLEPNQVRLAAFHAVASGAHGLLFRSRSRLDATDRLTLLRANTLRWVNQQLDLVEPWAAAGTYAGEIETGNPSLRVAELRAPRSRLLVIIRRMPNQQYVIGPPDHVSATFEVYGVPDSDEVYHVTPHAMVRMEQQRAAGLRISFAADQLVSLVAITQDPLAINYLARQVEKKGQQYDRLLGDIAAELYAAMVETRQRLVTIDPAGVTGSGRLDAARRELQHFERLVETGGHDQAYPFLRQGLEQLSAVRFGDWANAVRSFSAPVASPLCVSFFLIPEHYALGQRLSTVRWGPNSLPGGDFENLSLLQQSGWKNEQRTDRQFQTSVELSLENPHAGRSALHLSSRPGQPSNNPIGSDAPPIRVTSAPVPIRPGQLVRIHGWVRIDEPITGTLNGFVVRDSLGGSALCQRIYQTRGWQEFTLFRAAANADQVQVDFELYGTGQVWLDDVTVSTLQPPPSQG